MLDDVPRLHSQTTVTSQLTLISRGKVRDIYKASRPDSLLFVASDRISAYDVILQNGIQSKGKPLTNISLFKMSSQTISSQPTLMTRQNRFGSRDQLEGRAMLVKKAKVIPIEAIARGYITGE